MFEIRTKTGALVAECATVEGARREFDRQSRETPSLAIVDASSGAPQCARVCVGCGAPFGLNATCEACGCEYVREEAPR